VPEIDHGQSRNHQIESAFTQRAKPR
jgi:hypothetical protein